MVIPKTNDNSKIAVIQTDIAYIKKDVSDIKDVLKTGYVTKESIIDIAKETERRIVALENSSNYWKWISPVISSIFTAIFTFLSIQYLTNK